MLLPLLYNIVRVADTERISRLSIPRSQIEQKVPSNIVELLDCIIPIDFSQSRTVIAHFLSQNPSLSSACAKAVRVQYAEVALDLAECAFNHGDLESFPVFFDLSASAGLVSDMILIQEIDDETFSKDLSQEEEAQQTTASEQSEMYIAFKREQSMVANLLSEDPSGIKALDWAITQYTEFVEHHNSCYDLPTFMKGVQIAKNLYETFYGLALDIERAA